MYGQVNKNKRVMTLKGRNKDCFTINRNVHSFCGVLIFPFSVKFHNTAHFFKALLPFYSATWPYLACSSSVDDMYSFYSHLPAVFLLLNDLLSSPDCLHSHLLSCTWLYHKSYIGWKKS